MKRFTLVFLFWSASVALAHDLITAEAAERYLDKAVLWREQILSADSAQDRGSAHVRTGMMLDDIREMLNRDLAVHGKVQGLASSYLVEELKRVGAPLAYSETRRMFLANTSHYRAAIALNLTGTLGREARMRLLRGDFYDSFDFDPLQATQTWVQVQEQIALANDLVDSITTEPNREEVHFIATFVYARAAKLAPDANVRTDYREKALALAQAFERQYRDGMRSAAMPVVREALR